MNLSKKGLRVGRESSSFLGAGELLPWIFLDVLLGRGPAYLPSRPPQVGPEVFLGALLIGFGNFTVQNEGRGDIPDQGVYRKAWPFCPGRGKSGNEASGAKTTGTCFIVLGQGKTAGRLEICLCLTKPRPTSEDFCHPWVQGRLKLPLSGG